MALEIGGWVLKRRQLSKVQLLVALACALFLIEIVVGVFLYMQIRWERGGQQSFSPTTNEEIARSLVSNSTAKVLTASEQARVESSLVSPVSSTKTKK